jgi:hypothetical protein
MIRVPEVAKRLRASITGLAQIGFLCGAGRLTGVNISDATQITDAQVDPHRINGTMEGVMW